MDNTKKTNKKFWLTLVLAVVIAALIGIAFVPTILEKRTKTEATSAESSVDAEAMRVLGCCNAYVAVNSFKTTMNGSVKAKVMGVPYTQKIHGGRAVDASSGDFSDKAESKSALVKAAIKRERRSGEYYVSRGEYKNKAFKYNSEKTLSKNGYISQYGQPFTGIVKYNLENAVISAKAVSKNVYKFVLDPARATVYSRNEVKTTLGGKSYPTYKTVEFTLTVDGDRPVKVSSTEKFRINKFGGTDCTAKYTETFSF
ncbi:MAG: hypothetical protein J1F69_05360 [Clostridiales bacterium]|nr:hypothetical protein [Clostridiales bacterium]